MLKCSPPVQLDLETASCLAAGEIDVRSVREMLGTQYVGQSEEDPLVLETPESLLPLLKSDWDALEDIAQSLRYEPVRTELFKLSACILRDRQSSNPIAHPANEQAIWNLFESDRFQSLYQSQLGEGEYRICLLRFNRMDPGDVMLTHPDNPRDKQETHRLMLHLDMGHVVGGVFGFEDPERRFQQVKPEPRSAMRLQLGVMHGVSPVKEVIPTAEHPLPFRCAVAIGLVRT